MKQRHHAAQGFHEGLRRRFGLVGDTTKPRIIILAIIGMLVGFTVQAATAFAHPHAWIDLRSTVVLDETGRVIAIEQEWLFDDFYWLCQTKTTGPTTA